MATTQNESRVRLTATDETSTAFASVKGKLGDLGGAADGVVGKLGQLSNVLAGGVAFAAIGRSLSNTINEFDRLGKEAQKVGASVEALSRLSYAAKLSDLGTEQLSTGMRQLSRSMAEFPEKFSALGISVTDASGKLRATDDVMFDLADKFASAPDSAEKTAAAMELMGRSGSDMIPMLNLGADGLRAMGDEADRLGITVSTDMAVNAETFNDSMTRIAASSQGVGYTLANVVLPPLASMMEYLAGGQLGSDIFDFMQGIASFFERIGASIDDARASLLEFVGAAKLAAKAREDAARQRDSAQTRDEFVAMTSQPVSIAQVARTGRVENIGNVGKPKASRTGRAAKAAKEPAFFSGVDLTDTKDDFEMLAFKAEWDERLELEAEKQAELEEMNRQHRQRILDDYLASTDAQMRIAAAQIEWDKWTATEKTQFVLSEAQNLTAGLATVSKAAFNANKAAAIAQTTITTYESAVKAFNAYAGIPIVGPVIGAVAAASAIAMGVARVKAIKSTQFGASGAAGAAGIPSFQGGIASATQSASQPFLTASPPSQASRAQAAPPPRQVTLIVENDSPVSASWITDRLIPAINEQIGNGVELRAQMA